MSSKNVMPRVLLLGDSLTQQGFSSDGHWVSMLSDALIRKCDVVNRGFSGYNTRNIRQQLNNIDLFGGGGVGTAAVIIFLGANDANDPDVKPNSNQFVPLPEYKENLRYIVDHLLSSGYVTKDKIILIPPPPCDVAAWRAHSGGSNLSGPPKNNELNREYYDACVAVAAEAEVETVDIWDAFMDKPRCFSDGLHFSRMGAETLFGLVWPLVEKRAPKENWMPDWKEIN